MGVFPSKCLAEQRAKELREKMDRMKEVPKQDSQQKQAEA